MTETPQTPDADRKKRERKLALRIGGGVFITLLVMEILLISRAVSPVLVAFTLVFAAITAFVIWLVRDTLHDKKQRDAAAAESSAPAAEKDSEGT